MFSNRLFHPSLGVVLLSIASLLSSNPATATPGDAPQPESPSDTTLAQAPPPDNRIIYDAQPLSTSVLDLVLSELSPDRELVGDQSFLLDVPNVGEVAFVTTKFNPQGATRLRLDWRPSTSENAYYPLPVAEAIPEWILWEVKAIAFGDYNQDGLGPDVIAIADFIVGAGPRGSEPFPVATVYFYQGNNVFTTDVALNRTLAAQGAATVGAVIPEIEHYLDVLNNIP
ncbi:MAG: hypothetical protein ACPGVO_00835 [Spirulinaceae cyanobacterium]